MERFRWVAPGYRTPSSSIPAFELPPELYEVYAVAFDPAMGRQAPNALLAGKVGSRRTVLVFPVPDFVE